MSNDSYYIRTEGEKVEGPFSLADLRNSWAVGNLPDETTACRGEPDDETEWRPLKDIFSAGRQTLSLRKRENASTGMATAEEKGEPFATAAQKGYLIKHGITHSGVILRLTERQAEGMITRHKKRRRITRLLVLLVLVAALAAVWHFFTREHVLPLLGA